MHNITLHIISVEDSMELKTKRGHNYSTGSDSQYESARLYPITNCRFTSRQDDKSEKFRSGKSEFLLLSVPRVKIYFSICIHLFLCQSDLFIEARLTSKCHIFFTLFCAHPVPKSEYIKYEEHLVSL